MKKIILIIMLVLSNIVYTQNTANGTGYVLGRPSTTDCSNTAANRVRFGNGTHRLEMCVTANNLVTSCGGGNNKDDQIYVYEDQDNNGTPETFIRIITPASGNVCFMGTTSGNGYLYLLFCPDGTCDATDKTNSSVTLSWTSYTTPVNNLIGNPIDITTCAVAFNANNYAANNTGNCAGYTGNAGPPSFAIISLYNDLDCNTLSAGATAPYNGNGGDVGYSLENDIWYRFCPGILGTWNINITPSRCYLPNSGTTTTTYGFQYALFQGTSTNLGNVISGGTNGQNLTAATSVNIVVTSTASCYYLSLDGYGGTGCSFSAVITPPAGLCTILPIELLSFTVENIDNENIINWVTASERDNDYFTIEHSIDGYNWNILTKIDGSGIDNSGNMYEYIHDNYTKTINYYRLKQTDFNGVSKYFETIVINNTIKQYDIFKIYNMLGQEVDMSYKGLKIIQYVNGTIEKKY